MGIPGGPVVQSIISLTSSLRGQLLKCFSTVKILKFGTPQTIAIIVLKIEKFDVTLHLCIQKMLMEWQTA